MKYEVLNHLFLDPNFLFWGLFKGVLASVILIFFAVGQSWWSALLNPLPPHTHNHPTHPNIKLPTALLENGLLCLLVSLPQEIQDLPYNISMAYFLTIDSLSDELE